MFVGAHFWFVPEGSAITSPSASVVSQNGVWPDANEPNWNNYYLGIIESFDIDPKYGPSEDILVPSPGAVQAEDRLIPYAIPEVKIAMLDVPALAIQLALNTQQLFPETGVDVNFNPNGGGGPGVRGILKAQNYDQKNNLILNYQNWTFMQLDGSLKGAPKTLTKPAFVGTLLASNNNSGLV